MERNDVDDVRMSFGEHLEELRRVVLRSLIAIGIAFLVCFVFLREPLMTAVLEPHNDVVRWVQEKEGLATVSPPQALAPQTRIIAYLKVCALAGLVIVSPIVAWLIWSFVGAGLYSHERRLVYTIVPFSSGLFLAGIAFAYFVLLPYALRFLYNYGTAWIETNVDLSKYLSFFLMMELLMGFVFQIPLVSLALQSMRILTADKLRHYRKHAILGMCIFAAAFTPPDWVTLLVTVGPMAILYELGIWVGKLGFGKQPAERPDDS